MYMSCFHLKTNSPSVMQCLRDANDMHRNVMKMFPQVSDASARKELGILYRLYRTDHETRLYISSKDLPDASSLSYGFEMIDTPKDLAPVLDGFTAGRTYRFDLFASPTKKVESKGINSKRIFLISSKDRHEWLNRKAADAGFQIVWAREEGQETVHAALRQGESAITCVGVQFCGVLKVVDGAAFQKAYTEGIGSQKAYGMGMLLLAATENG